MFSRLQEAVVIPYDLVVFDEAHKLSCNRESDFRVRKTDRYRLAETIADTLAYDLTQGDVSEQKLYDETTEYLRHVYNKAKVLNQSAARLAMGVFQRRLASLTYALLCSFELRIRKLSARNVASWAPVNPTVNSTSPGTISSGSRRSTAKARSRRSGSARCCSLIWARCRAAAVLPSRVFCESLARATAS